MEYESNADRNWNWHPMIKCYVMELDSMVELEEEEEFLRLEKLYEINSERRVR